MAKAKFTSKPAPIAPQKPRTIKRARLLKQELEAHFLPVGITALEDIRYIWLALDALMGILLTGDKTKSAIGDLMRLPVKKLGTIVNREFPDLVRGRQKLQELQALNSGQKGGAR
jgi:hypothetical protein